MDELLVVAAEASGDALAAAAVRASGRGAWGMGGDRLREAGARVEVDLRRLNANGLGDALRVAPRALSIVGRLALDAARRRPRAALLVDSTALNRPLGRALRGMEVPVVWCVAPQVWAWRPGRAPALARSMDRLAALFAFEVPLWRRLGVDARWVGHPAVDAPLADRAAVRARLGLGPSAPALALLPGSRPGEVRRLLGPFVEAAAALARGDGVRSVALLAPSLPADLAAWARALAGRAGVEVQTASGGLGSWLPAFDAALCASGTASLECALAGVAPVVAYRVDALSAWAARRWLRIEHVALPSVLLGRRVFPELLQERADAPSLAFEARRLLGEPATAVAAELRALLDPGDGRSFGERVAAMLP